MTKNLTLDEFLVDTSHGRGRKRYKWSALPINERTIITIRLMDERDRCRTGRTIINAARVRAHNFALDVSVDFPAPFELLSIEFRDDQKEAVS